MPCFPNSPQPYGAGKQVTAPKHFQPAKFQKIKKMKESLKNRVAEIKSAIKDQVSDTYLARSEAPGVEGNSLPKTGVFGKYKTSGEKTADNDFRHIRMTVKGSDDSVSIGNLKLIAPMKGETLEFGTINREGSALKGKKFLRGKAINPKFAQYSTLELIAYLEDKSFTAEPVDAIQLRFNRAGYDNPDPIKDTRNVTAYKVTVVE